MARKNRKSIDTRYAQIARILQPLKKDAKDRNERFRDALFAYLPPAACRVFDSHVISAADAILFTDLASHHIRRLRLVKKIRETLRGFMHDTEMAGHAFRVDEKERLYRILRKADVIARGHHLSCKP